MAISVRFTNADHTIGTLVIDGQEWSTPIPPNAGDLRAVYDRWIEEGNVPERYVEPPAPVPSSISDRQFFQQLAIDGDISQDEAIANVATGEIPPAMQDAVDGLPANQRFAALMMLKGATSFERAHPMVGVLGMVLGKDEAALDRIWTEASKL